MVILFLFLKKGTTILFSVMTASFYIPTNSAEGFQVFHILTNNCCFLGFFLINYFFLITAILMDVR